MPLDRPVLTARDARTMAVAAFTPGSCPQWGLEVETVIRRSTDPAGRPGLAELPACHDLASGSRVTVEPGGQLEISTLTHPRVDDVLDTVAADERELGHRLAAVGLRPTSGAVDVYRCPARILALPRYQAMEAFFDARGPDGRQMMCNTASLQINISHHATDPARRWRLLHTLGPVLVAAFANSPGRDSDGACWASLRQRIWAGIDPGRTTAPDLSADPVDAWADYALAADVMLIRTGRAGTAMAAGLLPGLSFGDWLRRGHPTGWPSADDLAYHVTTLFPPIRPRGWLELRMLDALPPAVREVAVIVIAAALQDQVDAELIARMPDTSELWTAAARHGLRHDLLAGAARLLFDLAMPAVPLVTNRDDRLERVLRYRDSHIAQRLQPWAGRSGDVWERRLTRTG